MLFPLVLLSPMGDSKDDVIFFDIRTFETHIT